MKFDLKEGSTVAVLGAGRSGLAASRYLLSKKMKVLLFDEKENLKDIDSSIDLRSGITFNNALNTDGIDYCVLSPGISIRCEAVRSFIEAEIPVVGELEFALDLLDLPKILITGTNGKSTTSALTHHLLNSAGIKSYLVGNIGRAASELLLVDEDLKDSILVVEVSSYQLESTRRLPGAASAVLNLSENHLERHGTLMQYLLEKSKVFRGQKPDELAIYNRDDEIVSQLRGAIMGAPLSFGTSPLGDTYGALILNGAFMIQLPDLSYSVSNTADSLIGSHNNSNIAASILLVSKWLRDSVIIENALNTFKGLSYRLEIKELAGKIVINDSKATTPDALKVAIEAVHEECPGESVCLLLGGALKEGSWDNVNRAIRSARISSLIFFGRDGALLKKRLGWKGESVYAPTLREAVANALKSPEDIILFSPGCASFDEFSDFEDRGRKFWQYAQK